MESEIKSVIINGKKAIYFEKNADNAAKTFVILHGFPGNYEGLMELANQIDEGYRIVIPNFPACGGSDPLAGSHTLSSYAEWLNEFLEAISVEKATIIGHSFGSRVGLVFVNNFPEKAEKFVLITPVLKPAGPLPYIVLLKYEIAKMMPKDFQLKFLASPLYEVIACKIVLKSNKRNKRKEIIARGIREQKYIDPDTHIELFDEFYKTDLSPLAKSLKIETLVIAGDRDKVAPLKSIKNIFKGVEKNTLKVMKKSGHLVPFEEPKAVAQIIKLWEKNDRS